MSAQRTAAPALRTAVVRSPAPAALLALVLVVVGVVGVAGERPVRWEVQDPAGLVVFGAGTAAAGLAVLARRPGDRVGQLLTATGLLLLAGAATAPFGRVGDRLALAGVCITLPLAVLTFPRDRLRPAGIRWTAATVVLIGAALVAADGARVPTVAGGSVVGCLVVGAGWWGFETSTGDERRRLLWVVFGATAAVAVAGHASVLLTGLLSGRVEWGVLLVAALLLPFSMAIGILDPPRLDVRAVIGSCALTAVMVELTVAVYAGFSAVIRSATGSPPPAGVAALLAVGVAAGFHPVAQRLRGAIDQVLFGGRADPVEVLAYIGDELRRGGGPATWLQVLCLSTGLPGAELWDHGRRVASVRPEESAVDPADPTGPTAATAVVPLWAGPDRVGELIVGLRGGDRALPRATARTLELVAGPLAQALHGAHLAAQLRDSRGRAVADLEDERRRLRRDLHDGLGPLLTGVAYTADAAGNLLTRDPARAAELLASLREETADAIAEVRRIVYGMRPVALDELGLVGAITQQAQLLRRPDGSGLPVSVESGPLPPLPAAVEVAVYRVTVEALTNTARHAPGAAAHVQLRVAGGDLVICVTDDAGVAPTGWVTGVGLSSMRERVEQVGGYLTAGGESTGGHVHAVIPLPAPEPWPPSRPSVRVGEVESDDGREGLLDGAELARRQPAPSAAELGSADGEDAGGVDIGLGVTGQPGFSADGNPQGPGSWSPGDQDDDHRREPGDEPVRGQDDAGVAADRRREPAVVDLPAQRLRHSHRVLERFMRRQGRPRPR